MKNWELVSLKKNYPYLVPERKNGDDNYAFIDNEKDEIDVNDGWANFTFQTDREEANDNIIYMNWGVYWTDYDTDETVVKGG